jgi:hypothetical protein
MHTYGLRKNLTYLDEKGDIPEEILEVIYLIVTHN